MILKYVDTLHYTYRYVIVKMRTMTYKNTFGNPDSQPTIAN